jgi:hypothetical protein
MLSSARTKIQSSSNYIELKVEFKYLIHTYLVPVSSWSPAGFQLGKNVKLAEE